MNVKERTDRERFYEPCPSRVRFLHDFFDENRADDFVTGMKAFADQWFSEYEDERDLPAAWHQLVRVAEDLGWDVGELADEDDDEEDE